MDDITNEDIAEMNQELESTRILRVQAALFPESLEESIAIPSVPSEHATPLQQLTMPAQLLKLAIRNLINFQHDPVTASGAIPELNLLLNSNDERVINRAAFTAHKLSKKASRSAMVQVVELMDSLVKLLETSQNFATLREVAGALAQMSRDPEGLLAIFRSLGIPALLRMLDLPDQKLVIYALTTLHNLLRYQKGAKEEVLQYNGSEKFIKYLALDNVKLLAVVINCLCILSYQENDVKLMLVEENWHYRLVEIMKFFHYEKLLFVASKLLYIVATLPETKFQILKAGAFDVCLDNLQGGVSERVARNCLYVLLNVSSAANFMENSIIIDYLVEQLASPDLEIIFCALAILSNLTCNNEVNKVEVFENKGVLKVLNALKTTVDDERCIIAAVATLRHITGMHEKAALAQDHVRLVDGIKIVMDLLESTPNEELVESLLGLLRHLSLCRENHDALLEMDAVNKIHYKASFFEQMQQQGHDYDKLLKVIYATIYELGGQNLNNQLENDYGTIIPMYDEDRLIINNASLDDGNVFYYKPNQDQQGKLLQDEHKIDLSQVDENTALLQMNPQHEGIHVDYDDINL